MAEALAERGCPVTVVERLDRVLPNLDPEMAAHVEPHVREHVDLRLGTDAAHACDPAPDLAVLSVGVRPATTLLSAAGAVTGPAGALLVDDRMRTSLDGVWAAGDCIAPLHLVTGSPAFVPLGTTANKTGRVAGTVAAGGDASLRRASSAPPSSRSSTSRSPAPGSPSTRPRAAGIAAHATDVVHRSRAKYYPGSRAAARPARPRRRRAVCSAPSSSGARARPSGSTSSRPRCTRASRVQDLARLDLSYAPPFSPVYDPLLVAAQAAERTLEAV